MGREEGKEEKGGRERTISHSSSDGCDLVLEEGEEGRVDGGVDDDSGAGDASVRTQGVARETQDQRDGDEDGKGNGVSRSLVCDERLARCDEGGKADSVDCVLEVCVGEDDDWGLGRRR